MNRDAFVAAARHKLRDAITSAIREEEARRLLATAHPVTERAAREYHAACAATYERDLDTFLHAVWSARE